MLSFRNCLAALFLLSFAAISIAQAQNINLQPKYGLVQKNDAQLAADKEFIKKVDDHYKGDRKKAANEISLRGWKYLSERNIGDAMRRFNQAWMLDNTCGYALWGMGAVQASNGMQAEAMKLFAEAEQTVGGNIDFQVDYAKAIGMAGFQLQDKAILKNAFSRFDDVQKKAPNHTMNLQNWAVMLFLVGDYAVAWEKIKLAEATPRRAEIDQQFIAMLQSKMPRP